MWHWQAQSASGNGRVDVARQREHWQTALASGTTPLCALFVPFVYFMSKINLAGKLCGLRLVLTQVADFASFLV